MFTFYQNNGHVMALRTVRTNQHNDSGALQPFNTTGRAGQSGVWQRGSRAAT